MKTNSAGIRISLSYGLVSHTCLICLSVVFVSQTGVVLLGGCVRQLWETVVVLAVHNPIAWLTEHRASKTDRRN